MHSPSSTLHAAHHSRRGVRQGLMRVAVVLLTVVVGVAVLDQRRVSKRNVRSHDTYWSYATYWPSRAARETRLAAPDGEERELVDGEAEGAGSEETEAPTAARAPMPWPTPAPRPRNKAPPLFDDENVDDAATEFPTPERAPMPWPTPAPTPRPRPGAVSGGLVF